jgi:hypothetical protein
MGFKLEPVIFQNIGQCRGNGVIGALYIHQVLRPHTNCKDGSTGRTTTSCGVGDKSVSDNVVTNWWLPVVCRGPSESIIDMLSTNVHIW